MGDRIFFFTDASLQGVVGVPPPTYLILFTKSYRDLKLPNDRWTDRRGDGRRDRETDRHRSTLY